jgi:hypothetical protein
MIENGAPFDMLYEWDIDKMLEVTLDKPDDFLKVRETLTRMGIASKKPDMSGKTVLTQSCHLLHKRGRYYIVHFKELFMLDGRESDLTIGDVERRNLIAGLLDQWGLVKIVNPKAYTMQAPMSSLRVVPHKEKQNFTFVTKYSIGKK